jgi:hypothetical protein
VSQLDTHLLLATDATDATDAADPEPARLGVFATSTRAEFAGVVICETTYP